MASVYRSLLFVGALLAVPSLASSLTLSGTVRDETTNVGVPGLTVKVTPPRSSGGRQVATSTNQAGVFVLRGVDAGRYLLEVGQGTAVLFREVITLDRDTRKDVRLRR